MILHRSGGSAGLLCWGGGSGAAQLYFTNYCESALHSSGWGGATGAGHGAVTFWRRQHQELRGEAVQPLAACAPRVSRVWTCPRAHTCALRTEVAVEGAPAEAHGDLAGIGLQEGERDALYSPSCNRDACLCTGGRTGRAPGSLPRL